MSGTGGRAVVFLRTKRGGREMARVLRSIADVRRVERLRGPYDLVVHADGREGVDAIERLPAVSRADVCWFSVAACEGLETTWRR
jgi:hypothetical protein